MFVVRSDCNAKNYIRGSMNNRVTTAPTAMLEAATTMLKNAYAPYSNFQVGCCIKGADGKLYTGCNVENASYSLTQCAESVAIGSMVANGCTKITAVLVTTNGDLPICPCGSCRQRLLEFCEPDTPIYSCATQAICNQYRFDEMMPFTFSKTNLDHNQND